MALLCEGGGQVERRRGLGHPALLVGECDDLGLCLPRDAPMLGDGRSRRALVFASERDDSFPGYPIARLREPRCARGLTLYDPAMPDGKVRPAGAWRASASASARVPAGSARRLPRPRWRWGLPPAGSKVAVVTIDPAKAACDRARAGAALRRAALIDPQRCSQGGVEVKGRDVGDDAGRQAHAGRADRHAGARLGRARRRSSRTASTSELSSAVAGSQELRAIAKLYELHHEGDFDAIVLDTPPSRNALDFLDAPTRLLSAFSTAAH